MNLAFRLQRYVKQIEKGWQALCLSSTSDIWITQCEENLLPALQTLWLHPPKSCSSWLFRRAFSCWWNLCWSEHICSKYWQVLLLSVWNRCLIPSDVFWRQIFFFCRVAKVCRVETLFFFFPFMCSCSATYVEGNLLGLPPGEAENRCAVSVEDLKDQHTLAEDSQHDASLGPLLREHSVEVDAVFCQLLANL